MTPAEASVLLHTLGLDARHREPYRNHFVAGDGHHDLPALLALVEAGLLVERERPTFLPAGDRVFHATEHGTAVARVENMRINPPPSAAKARYLRWLTVSDVCPDLTFGAFLRRRMYQESP